MTALLIGTALAVASLCYVIYPLVRANSATARPAPRPDAPVEDQGYAVDALRELEFDRQTGKISDADYAPLKARYTEQALTVMRSETGAGMTLGVGNYSGMACPNCGSRPEADAVFCSSCGARLPA